MQSAFLAAIRFCLPGLALVAAHLLASAQAADVAGTPTPNQDVRTPGVRMRSLDDRHRSITYSGPGWTPFEPGSGWKNGTAKSSRTADEFFEYAHPDCTRLKWFSTKSNSRGKADVHVDGALTATVDTYSTTNQTTSAVFDSGTLPPGQMDVRVNGERAATGTPGSYASIRRTWANHDVITFTLPMGFTTVKDTGLDQAPGNVDRYALLWGPILMALNDAAGRIRADAKSLPGLLTAAEGSLLRYDVQGTACRFVPYWQVEDSFTCFPMVQP